MVPGLPPLGLRRGYCLHRDVIDQSRIAEPCRNQDAELAVANRSDRRQRIGVPNLEIIEREAGAADRLDAAVQRRLEVVASPWPRRRLPHRAEQFRRAPPLFRGEINVTGRHREPVALAYDFRT